MFCQLFGHSSFLACKINWVRLAGFSCVVDFVGDIKMGVFMNVCDEKVIE